MDYEIIIGAIIWFLAVTIIVVMVAISANLNALGSEDAQKQCELRGYDNYESFKRTFNSPKAMGVRCNHINNKKEIMINEPSIIAIKS